MRFSHHITATNHPCATFTARKLPIETDGAITGFSAHVTSMTDYYPFGSALTGRMVESTYPYGFQGQETDPEYFNGAVSFKYRVHDARLGRFLSIDPLAPDYPWNSTFAFSENRVIDGVELEGLERMDANGRIIYSNLSLRQFTDGLVQGRQWGGGNQNGPSFGHVPRNGGNARVEWLQCMECQDQWSSGNQWFWRVQQEMPRIQPTSAQEVPNDLPQLALQTPVVPIAPDANPGFSAPSLQVAHRVVWSNNDSFFSGSTMATGEAKLREIAAAMTSDARLAYQVNISTPRQLSDVVGDDGRGNRTNYSGGLYADLLQGRYDAIVDYILNLNPNIDANRLVPNFQPGTNQDFSVEPL